MESPKGDDLEEDLEDEVEIEEEAIIAAEVSGDDEEAREPTAEEPFARDVEKPDSSEEDPYWDTLKTWQWGEEESEPGDRSEHRERRDKGEGEAAVHGVPAAANAPEGVTVRRRAALARGVRKAVLPKAVGKGVAKTARKAAGPSRLQNVRGVNSLRPRPVLRMRNLTTSVPDFSKSSPPQSPSAAGRSRGACNPLPRDDVRARNLPSPTRSVRPRKGRNRRNKPMRTVPRAAAGVAGDRGREGNDRGSRLSDRSGPSPQTRLRQRSRSKPRTSPSPKTNPRRNLASSRKGAKAGHRVAAIAVVAVRAIAAHGGTSRPKRL